HQTEELGVQRTKVNGDRAQNGVEGCEIPDRRNVIRRLEVIGFFKVGILEEEPVQLGHEEEDKTEDKQEDGYAHQVVHSVIRMESHAVERNTVFIFVFLDFDTVGV